MQGRQHAAHLRDVVVGATAELRGQGMRAEKGGAEIRKVGVAGVAKRLRCYCSTETHTWVQKAADISGLGTDSVRWIASDKEQRLDLAALGEQLQRDRESGDQPFLVAGTAGTVRSKSL